MARRSPTKAKSGREIASGDSRSYPADAADSEILSAAQDVVYDAWETDSRPKRIALARKALKISPLCADAYVILSEETAKNPDEAIGLYRQGVAAGEKALGEAAFRDDVGHFWSFLETRPYMRARQGLAWMLWEAGFRDEAVTHYQDMLRLNPNDNQGVRYLLLDCLLALGRDPEAQKLLEQYEDDAGAGWGWSKALLSFRRVGDTALSRDALAQAVTTNEHVPGYLLGDKAMPEDLPDFISWGDETEAIAYAHAAAEAWVSTPGAWAWLRAAGPRTPTQAPQLDQTGSNELESDVDHDRIDDAILALLRLGLHDRRRVWKTFDWEAMSRLHEKGLISSPVGKAKSVELTEDGFQRSGKLLRDLFGRR